MHRFIKFAILIAGISGLTATIPGAAHAADGPKPIKLKIVSFTGPLTPTVKDIFLPMIREIESAAATGNITVDIQTYWGGSLGGSPAKIFRLLETGVADIALVLPSLVGGRFPDAELVQLPFFAHSTREAASMQLRLHQDRLLRGFNGLVPLALYASGPAALHMARPITRAGDLAGLKFMVMGANQLRITRALGLTAVTSVPIPKASETLALGVIDGAIMGWNAVKAFRLDRSTTHHVNLPLGFAPQMIVINAKSHTRLPAAVRSKLDINRASFRAARVHQEENDRLLARFTAEPNRRMVQFTAPEIEDTRQRLQALHTRWSGKSAANAKRYRLITSHLQRQRANK